MDNNNSLIPGVNDNESIASFLSHEQQSLKLHGARDYIVLTNPAYHMGLYYLELMLKIVQQYSPVETSLDHYFYHFSKTLGGGSFHPAEQLWQLVKAVHMTSDKFHYSDYIEALRVVLNELRFATDDEGRTVESATLGNQPLVLWSALIHSLWNSLTSSAFTQKCKRSEKRLIRTTLSMEGYVLKLLEKYKRLLVLRVDLAYETEHAVVMTEAEARADLARLLANRRYNQNLLPDLVGYVCRIEWTPKARYHFHVVFLLDGDKRQKGGYLAQVVGRYWVDVITRGKGRFENCNRSQRDFDKCGVGMIHLKNPMEVDNLMKRALGYLVKKQQYLVATVLGHRKCIWRGSAPVSGE